uniref:DNA-directed DNA polymerase n=1 Tax=Cliftonaea pectinata TaxID=2007206 RepID=A0A1Z1MQ35_9FLOR|nr:hypothetical protein [Cliftonaea pectinata]ARW68046.1 hypothetical protein [Cliftonaea pectinata]
MSWYPPNNTRDILKTNSEIEENSDEICNNDYTRIYSREIHLSILQEDGLEWIRNCLGKQEREELLEKAFVIAAAFYPKSLQCKTIEEFNQKRIMKTGENHSFAYIEGRRTLITKISHENHYWYKENIGDILTDKLIDLRKSYSKEVPSEEKMNSFIKLVINTSYGDLVSPYFYIANTIVGNNITARARCMAWYMEKSLHGTQTITDGCSFNINKVTKSRYTLTNKKYFYLKKRDHKKIYHLVIL